MRGESGEEKWEVRCDSLFHRRGVKWIYICMLQAQSRLDLFHKLNFLERGVSLVVSVSGVSLDATARMSANLGERLWKGSALSQSD